MFNIRLTTKPDTLDMVIDKEIATLLEIGIDDPKYTLKLDRIATLIALREKTSGKRVSPDAVVAAIAQLLAVLAIIKHEQIGNVITTKALGFVPKVR